MFVPSRTGVRDHFSEKGHLDIDNIIHRTYNVISLKIHLVYWFTECQVVLVVAFAGPVKMIPQTFYVHRLDIRQPYLGGIISYLTCKTLPRCSWLPGLPQPRPYVLFTSQEPSWKRGTQGCNYFRETHSHMYLYHALPSWLELQPSSGLGTLTLHLTIQEAAYVWPVVQHGSPSKKLFLP